MIPHIHNSFSVERINEVYLYSLFKVCTCALWHLWAFWVQTYHQNLYQHNQTLWNIYVKNKYKVTSLPAQNIAVVSAGRAIHSKWRVTPTVNWTSLKCRFFHIAVDITTMKSRRKDDCMTAAQPQRLDGWRAVLRLHSRAFSAQRLAVVPTPPFEEAATAALTDGGLGRRKRQRAATTQ